MQQFNIKNVDEEMLEVVNQFPEIFLDPSPEVLEWFEKGYLAENKEDLVNLRFGFECKNGWKELIRGFCCEISALVDQAKKSGKDITYKSCIIKQKFGSLRFQGDFYGADAKEFQNKYYEILSKWEGISQKVCEVTGKEGRLVNNNGHWQTLSETIK